MSAPAATDASAPKPKGKKMIVIIAAVVVLLAVAGGAFMFMKKGGDAEEGEDGGKAAAEVAHAKPKEGTPPTFLPLENMVVNLAAGLDTRPYRMDLPSSLLWVEVDLPDLLDYKEGVLKSESPR